MSTLHASIALTGLPLLLAACDQPLSTSSEVPAFTHVAGVATGRAQMHPVNESGVRGTITFDDDGTTLGISGSARGLDPEGVYASLIYDNQSVPGGPEACEPAISDPSDPDFLIPTMLVGFWGVDGEGGGTLAEVNIVDDETGERVYVPLGKFKTISIRDLRINNGVGPQAIVACGEVATHPAG